jgi:hypothetical protein
VKWKLKIGVILKTQRQVDKLLRDLPEKKQPKRLPCIGWLELRPDGEYSPVYLYHEEVAEMLLALTSS